jgi:hypothetical protein
MKVGWAELQSGDYDITLNNEFFTAGAVIEADEAAGSIWYVPSDPNTGRLLYDQRTDTWAKAHAQGVVRIYPRPAGTRPC